jgi:beta-lactamase superfamily II metal-dependent hydrolase
MSFVLTLSDGSFIVYDGGFDDDAPILLDYLEKNNVRREKPRIAAWVLTHSHGDHYFAVKQIAANHADRVTVEEFVLNPRLSRYEHEQYEPYLGEVFPTDALPRFEGAVIVKPHTGQKLYYRDAEIEILHTQEEVLPNYFRWLNETSLVSRVYLGGQRIFFPADEEIGIDTVLPAMYGDALESEFLQEPHHAFSGGTYTLFDLVRPKVALFTCGSDSFVKYSKPGYNGGINDHLLSIVDESYYSGMGTKVFELPYLTTPKK